MAMMTPRSRAALRLSGGRGALDDEPSNVASTVLGVLGSIGGGIAGGLTGGPQGAVAGAGLGNTLGQTAGNLMEGNEEDMMQRVGEAGQQFTQYDKAQKSLELQKKLQKRMKALGIEQ
jgi:outer membrane lipoprotein SlyB